MGNSMDRVGLCLPLAPLGLRVCLFWHRSDQTEADRRDGSVREQEREEMSDSRGPSLRKSSIVIPWCLCTRGDGWDVATFRRVGIFPSVEPRTCFACECGKGRAQHTAQLMPAVEEVSMEQRTGYRSSL